MDSDSNPHDIKRWLKRQRRFFRGRAEQSRVWFKRRDGSQGPASACRRISPVSGEVVEVIENYSGADSLEVALTYGYYQPEEWPSA